jgi:hypothetical protein
MSTNQRDQTIFNGLIKQAASAPSSKTDQQRLVIDLTTAHDWEEIPYLRTADFMIVESNTGTCKVRFNEPNGPEFDLSVYHSFVKSSQLPIERVYLYNAAQAGKAVTLALGGDSSLQATTNPTVAAITGAISIADTAGTTINPTEMATTPVQYTKTLAVADTEYDQALPAGTKKFLIQCRDDTSVIRYAVVTGKVAAPTDPYGTVKANKAYNEDQIKAAAVTLYLASATAGAVVEITAWS